MARSFMHYHGHTDPFSDSNFAALFNELYPALCRYCLNLVGEKEIAEDIVLEKFIYIWENRNRLGNSVSLKSYLYTAVKHRSFDYLKIKFGRASGIRPEDISEITINDNIPDPAEILENKELGEILDKALAHLPEKCRIIFTMKKIGGFTNKEVANKLNISVKTVENQTTIALKRLIKSISDYWN